MLRNVEGILRILRIQAASEFLVSHQSNRKNVGEGRGSCNCMLVDIGSW